MKNHYWGEPEVTSLFRLRFAILRIGRVIDSVSHVRDSYIVSGKNSKTFAVPKSYLITVQMLVFWRCSTTVPYQLIPID